MNDEPKEAKGTSPGMNPPVRARGGAKLEGQPPPSDDLGAGASGEQQAKPVNPPGEPAIATNDPPVADPRRLAGREQTEPSVTSPPLSSSPPATGTVARQDQEESLKEVSIPGRMILNTITGYAQTMKPGHLLTQVEGMRQQVSFCNAIFAAINTLDADFRPVMTAILAILHRERDAAFRETHLFRYWDSVALSKNQRRGFEKIITLLKTLADPKTRQTALRQVDFERLLQYGLTEKGRTRLAAYFGK